MPPLNGKAVQNLAGSSGWENINSVHKQFSPLDETAVSGKHVRLELAGHSAILEVEEMIQQAAAKGEGFALDEFNEDGMLNRKLLRHSITLAACRISDKALIGGAVIGPSNLTREIHTSSLGGYVVIGEEFRRQGYGTDVVTICERIGQTFGYSNVTSDILYSPAGLPALQLAMSKGYTVTGQIPECAYVKDVGFTGTFVISKNISH